MKFLSCALLLVASAALAQNRTTEVQARSYIQSAFITGAAHAILTPDVALGPRLRERLALPAQADRDRVYEAIFALTEDKRLKVRKSTATEAASATTSAAGRPVFTLEGGALPLVMVYDLDRNAIPYVAFPGAPAAAGNTSEPKAMRVSNATSAAAPAPAPVTVIKLKPIAFAFDEASLSARAKTELEREGLPKIVEIREVRYVVHGHADRLGSARHNQHLSERRAEAVRDYLVAKGVSAENIQTAGVGSSMPQTSCPQMNRRALIECLAPDRRVTVEIRPPPL